MKRLFSLAVVLIISLVGFSQSKLYIRGDTVNIRREGGNSTTIIDSAALIRKYLQIGGPASLANTYKNNSHLVIGDSATTKGLIIPRVQTLAAITDPKQGMVVYNISDSKFYFRTLTDWVGPSEGQTAIFETVADLKAAAVNEEGAIVLGIGSVDAGDGGEYYWDLESSATGDDYLVIDPPGASGTGRYHKIFKGKTRSTEFKIKGSAGSQTANMLLMIANATVKELVFDEPGSLVAFNGKIDFGGKTLRFENGAQLVSDGGTNDTIANAIIIADYRKQIFGAGVKAKDFQNYWVSVMWWNGRPDYVYPTIITDSYEALVQSHNATKNGGIIHLPGMYEQSLYGSWYYSSAPWVITKNVKVIGDGNYKSVILFPGNGVGIQLLANNCTLQDFAIRGAAAQNSAGFNSQTAHGFFVNSNGNRLKGLSANSFDGDGFRFQGDVGAGTNANSNLIEQCSAEGNGRFGSYTFAGDGNQIKFTNFYGGGNARANIVENGFLGNHYDNCNASSASIDHSLNKSTVTLGGRTYIAKESNGANRVSSGGNRYYGILEGNIGFTPPNATYWILVGAGGVSADYPAWSATEEYPATNAQAPQVGGNAYWKDFGTGFSAPFGAAYDSTVRYLWSAGYAVLSVASESKFTACYVEADQIELLARGSRAIYDGGSLGNAAANLGIAGSLTNYNGSYTSPNFQSRDATKDVAVRLDAANQTFGFYKTSTGLDMGFKALSPTDITGFTFQAANTGGGNVNFYTLYSNSATLLGRDIHPDNGGYLALYNGVFLRNITTGKYGNLLMSNSIPTTGTYDAGNIVFNGTPGSNVIGWRNTVASVAGNGGTWEELKGSNWAVTGSDIYYSAGKVGFGLATSPLATVHIKSNGGVNSGINLELATAGSYGAIDFNTTGGLLGQFLATGTGYGASGAFQPDQLALANYAAAGFLTFIAGGASSKFNIYTGGYAAGNKRFEIDAAGTITFGPLLGTGNRLMGLDLNGAGYRTTLDPANISVTGHTHAFADLTSKPTTLSGYGITDAVPAARTLTINGTTQDLSANRTYTVDGVFTTTTFATTNATPTNVITYATATNERGVIEVTLTGVKSNGDGITGKKIVAYKNIAGTLTLGTITEDLATVADGDLSTAVWTVSVSGTNVIVVFTGIAATVIDGTTSHKITKVIPAS